VREKLAVEVDEAECFIVFAIFAIVFSKPHQHALTKIEGVTAVAAIAQFTVLRDGRINAIIAYN
jgi:hypothetical protein